MHRGGAVFLQGVTNITLSQLNFDQLEGNGVTFSNFVRDSEVSDCDFWRTGDSAVVALGSTRLSNGTASEYPHLNRVERNYFDTVGVNMKQTSCYFKAITYANTVKDNICFQGPRAGLNWNDGFMVRLIFCESIGGWLSGLLYVGRMNGCCLCRVGI